MKRLIVFGVAILAMAVVQDSFAKAVRLRETTSGEGLEIARRSGTGVVAMGKNKVGGGGIPGVTAVEDTVFVITMTENGATVLLLSDPTATFSATKIK